MLGKPARHYAIFEEKGLLQVTWSKEFRQHYIAIAGVYVIFNLVLLGLFVVINSPLTTHQWVVLISIGACAILFAIALLVYILGQYCIFDRAADRFLQGKKRISRTGSIQHVQMNRELDIYKREYYCLSVVLEEGKPDQLYRLEPPATELFRLAETIANYLKIKLVNKAQC